MRVSRKREAGSSPLTRGKQGHLHALAGQAGLIPAHAGKTCPHHLGSPRTKAHPRSRGENTADDALTAQPAGSSPLTRGKRPDADGGGSAKRLIPAHAGKTVQPATSEQIDAAHPRSRGENVIVSVLADTKKGSSPLTRGKPHSGRPQGRLRGLIPAHAGKTSSASIGRWSPWAHPRSRGENHALERAAGRSQGSSPLTRGKQDGGSPRRWH